MQSDMALEKELKVLHLDPKTTGSELRYWASLEQRKPQIPLPNQHTSSNKATPPNSATPCEIIGANSIQTTTREEVGLVFQWWGVMD